MRQILQNLKNGETTVREVPAPGVRPGHLLVRTQASLVSVGTERMLIDFGRANLIDKARQQPAKVRQVMDKMRADGVGPTLEAVRAKLDTEIPLGYSNAGVIVAVGAGVPDFRVGDRVVSNGPHAEVVVVPHRLCARIPDEVTADQAAWTVLGAIGLQGLRLAEPTLGETFAVVGLGPIGLLCVQLLRASGCAVVAVDLDAGRCELARGFGAQVVCVGAGEDPVEGALAATDGRGVDGVLLTLSTKSDEPVKQAATMCRKRGRIVLVGVTGLKLERSDFYRKELSFQVSCSYGPGRYDDDYELRGHDYPLPYVRWTEQRNFEAVLELMAAGRVQVDGLVTHREPIERAAALYEKIGQGEAVLGALLTYPAPEQLPDEQLLAREVATGGTTARASRRDGLGVLGAGNFATRMLVPILARGPLKMQTVVDFEGRAAAALARKHGFSRSCTDPDRLFEDERIGAVLVATRHDSHAGYVTRALETGRAVYVEKPLALSHGELDQVQAAFEAAEAPLVSVGFNRHFAPQTEQMRELLAPIREPKTMVMTVNAGVSPADSWVHHPEVGGGRIIGEGCHFVELLRSLAGAPITGWTVASVGRQGGLEVTDDKTTFTLTFADGSIGTVHYFGNGSKAFPKERLEVFVGGRVLQLDDFKTLRGWGWSGFRKTSLRRQDKGHRASLDAFARAALKGGAPPIPFGVLMEVSRATVDIAALARDGGGGPG